MSVDAIVVLVAVVVVVVAAAAAVVVAAAAALRKVSDRRPRLLKFVFWVASLQIVSLQTCVQEQLLDRIRG